MNALCNPLSRSAWNLLSYAHLCTPSQIFTMIFWWSWIKLLCHFLPLPKWLNYLLPHDLLGFYSFQNFSRFYFLSLFFFTVLWISLLLYKVSLQGLICMKLLIVVFNLKRVQHLKLMTYIFAGKSSHLQKLLKKKGKGDCFWRMPKHKASKD